jgi:hypothetical protein
MVTDIHPIHDIIHDLMLLYLPLPGRASRPEPDKVDALTNVRDLVWNKARIRLIRTKSVEPRRPTYASRRDSHQPP